MASGSDPLYQKEECSGGGQFSVIVAPFPGQFYVIKTSPGEFRQGIEILKECGADGGWRSMEKIWCPFRKELARQTEELFQKEIFVTV